MTIINIVDFFIKNLTDTATTYVSVVSVAIMGYIGGLMGTFFKISLVMLIVGWFFKRVPYSLQEIIDVYIKYTIIMIIALNFVHYKLIVDVFTTFPNGIAAAAITSFGGLGDVKSIDSLLGQFIKKGLDAAMISFAQGGYFMPYFIGAVIFLSTVASAAGLFVVVVLSKILLSIMLAIGPVFIVARMFNMWTRTFDMWIQQCANFALVPVFAYMVSTFTLTFSILAIDLAQATQSLAQALMVVFVAIINWVALKKCYELAASVSGGFASGDEYRARRAAYDLAKDNAFGNKQKGIPSAKQRLKNVGKAINNIRKGSASKA